LHLLFEFVRTEEVGNGNQLSTTSRSANMAKKSYIPAEILVGRIQDKILSSQYTFGVPTTLSRGELFKMFADFSSKYVNDLSYQNSLIHNHVKNNPYLVHDSDDRISLRNEMALRLKVEIQEVIDEADLSSDVEMAMGNYDFSDDISNALENVDFSDALVGIDFSEAIENYMKGFPFKEVLKEVDFSEDISRCLEEHTDFSTAIEEALNSHDFSDAFDGVLESFDFSDAISDAFSNYDFSDAISDALSNYDFSQQIKEEVETICDKFVQEDFLEKLLENPKFENFIATLVKGGVAEVAGSPAPTVGNDPRCFAEVFAFLSTAPSAVLGFNNDPKFNDRICLSYLSENSEISFLFLPNNLIQMSKEGVNGFDWATKWTLQSENCGWMNDMKQFIKLCDLQGEQ